MLGVRARFDKAQQDTGVDTRALQPERMRGSAAELSPDVVTDGSTCNGMQTSRPGHCTQHVYLGLVSGLAHAKFGPEVFQSFNSLCHCFVCVLPGHPKVAAQLPGMVDNGNLLGTEQLTEVGVS